MTTVGQHVVAAARSHIGAPFRNHFKPEDLCEHGANTIDHCMAVGLDDSGYDCSGLIVASICEALGIKVSAWKRDLRHLRQISRLVETGAMPKIGDILIFYPEDETETWMHMGVMATTETTIHADGIGKAVTESITVGISTNYQVVPLELLIRSSVS